jgi:hypothetical protein
LRRLLLVRTSTRSMRRLWGRTREPRRRPVVSDLA